MSDRQTLLKDLQTVLRTLETDLLERSETMPEVQTALAAEHQRATQSERTAQSYEDWRADYSTQMAAAWVLSGVFARFLEDNRLVDPPRIAGPGERLARARDEHELYFRAHPAFDVNRLVADLVEAESVPLLPVLRYKASGLRKRAAWEQTWKLQRQEDTRMVTGHSSLVTGAKTHDQGHMTKDTIPIPPKYTSSDFQNSTYWRLRGKLDVPKERWISFPYCAGDDGTLVIAWAGYDHLQLARAISAYYVDIQERLGGSDDPRLVPLLGCLIELLPWLKQWHNDVDPEFGMAMGDYFEGFIMEEARHMGKTLDQIKAWEPPKKMSRRRKKTMT